MRNCASCGVQHTEGPVCSLCKQYFDFSCAGITEGGYRKLGDRKNSWRCPRCKSTMSPGPTATSSSPNQLGKIQEQLNNVMQQLIPLALLVEDVKMIKNDLKHLTEAQESTHEIINNFASTLQALDTRVNNIELAAKDIPALKAQVAKIQRDLEEKDQWARANNVEIRGIPQKKNENLYEIAQKIGQISDFPINKVDINYIARIPTRVPNAEKPIVIAFNNRYIKEELVASSRRSKQLKLSNLGFSIEGNFHVNDHLTQKNKILLNKARDLAREKNYKYIWVKHCKIMVRKSDTSPVFFIRCENDLAKII
ncbi:unnamed protein product [Euphydryas editha]|uniref:FP protein C-terminal domain-containing protein n=1 Tax=Euphydryas editha TaxID=104508 RepID=A0AAU9UVT3_EUPED|nr:unnamed protein product [Euphydryas editha]